MKASAFVILLFVAKFATSQNSLQGKQYHHYDLDDICKMAPDEGPCRGRQLRWYYDLEIDQCTQFTYGGCAGNGNNFEKLEDCEEKCVPLRYDENTCSYPKDEGPCFALIDKWYFNKDERQCEPFEFGGCGGNPNNFETREECEQRCLKAPQPLSVCEQPKEPGPCKASFVRYFYNSRTKQCESFIYGGCQGNDNNFATLADCEAKCAEKKKDENPCKLPADSGPCGARLPRYYYDWDLKKCVMFTYGGCEGNGNNFKSIAECEAKCAEKKKEPENPCEQPAERGPCKSYFVRYYYNKASKKCETFIYGGCQGNENNFESLADCEAKCSEKKQEEEDPCEQPVEPGPCKAHIVRYYYNKASKKCEKFVYGGCQGNKNNFYSIAECEERCSVSTTPEPPTPSTPPPRTPSTPPPSRTPSIQLPSRAPSIPPPSPSSRTPSIPPPSPPSRTPSIPPPSRTQSTPPPSRTPSIQPPSRTQSTPPPSHAQPMRLPSGIPSKSTPSRTPSIPPSSSPSRTPSIPPPSRTQSTPPPSRTQPVRAPSGIPSKSTPSTLPAAGSEGCNMPKDTGTCSGRVRKWYFCREQLVCKPFFYSGCGGNANRYDTQQECEKRCVDPLPASAICSLPYARGSCGSIAWRWYYDITAKECKTFIYTGCGGNANNFRSKDKCLAKCAAV